MSNITYVSITPYIHETVFNERKELPPSNKLLVRIFYKCEYIPDFMYRNDVFSYKRKSVVLDVKDIPKILTLTPSELDAYLREVFDLKPYHVIHKSKMRHTIGGTGKRFKVAFTNSTKYPKPILYTDSTIDYTKRLSPTVKQSIKTNSFADMCGLITTYEMVSGDLKFYNYLKLVNFFNDDTLIYNSSLIIPHTYIDEFSFD